MATPLNVLILEDNPDDVELILHQLRQDGYEPKWERVDTRKDFQERLKPELDLILSDYSLPQFNGIEALALANQSGLEIPFILVSGTIGEDLAVQAIRAGAADYLLKDRLTRLGSAVDQALSQSRLRREKSNAVERLKLFRLLVDHSNDALEVIDPVTGRYLDVNEKGHRELGYTREEFLSLTVFDVDPLVDPKRWSEALAPLRLGGSTNGESRHRRKDGSTFPVEFSSKLISVDRDYLVAVVRDISQRKEMETQSFRAQRLESIGTLASGIAHDINNILVPILMSAPLLRLGLSEQETAETVDVIETSARRGAELVKQLLMFGRGVEGARLVIRPDDLVRETASIARQTFPKNIRIVQDAPRGLGPILGDSTQLHQVLLNLGVNARDAMPRGGMLTISAREAVFNEVSALSTPGANAGSYVMIRVSDTGIGISPEIMAKIFDPFFTTKELGQGTGLGLSTVVGILKSHGGFVTVKSDVGRGSTFEIYLPVARDGVPAPDVGRPAGAARGNGELVLLVDDEENIRGIIGDLLVKYGYRVITAGNGAAAITEFERHGNEIKVVITDLDMPVMSGVSLIRALKRINPEVATIVASGIASRRGIEQRKAELEGLGVRTILKKPFPIEDVLLALKTVLGRP